MDSNLEHDGISIMLARQIVALVNESGASQVEILGALGVVQSLLPTLSIPLVNAFDEESQR